MINSGNVIPYIRPIYNTMDSTTRDSDIAVMISGANAYISTYTGLSSGSTFDDAVTMLTCVRVIAQNTGGTAAGLSYTIGEITVDKTGNSTKFAQIADNCYKMLKDDLMVLGKKINYSITNL